MKTDLIRRLISQATVVKEFSHGDIDTYVTQFSETKFAELIVRECGQYLNSPEFIGRSDLDWAMVLNEHFGVEQ
jgi:hypothetical protein